MKECSGSVIGQIQLKFSKMDFYKQFDVSQTLPFLLGVFIKRRTNNNKHLGSHCNITKSPTDYGNMLLKWVSDSDQSFKDLKNFRVQGEKTGK